MVDPKTELRHQRALNVADGVLGQDQIRGQHVDLIHGPRVVGHDAHRQHPGEGGNELLSPTNRQDTPRNGAGGGLKGRHAEIDWYRQECLRG